MLSRVTGISFQVSSTSVGMRTSARTALVAILRRFDHAKADPQSERTIAMDEVRMVAQAEVLALLRLNTRLRDVLRNDANIKLVLRRSRAWSSSPAPTR